MSWPSWRTVAVASVLTAGALVVGAIAGLGWLISDAMHQARDMRAETAASP